MLKHIRDELLGIGADFHFQKYVRIYGNTLEVKHHLTATFSEDPKEAEFEEVLKALEGGLIVESRSEILDTALEILVGGMDPRVRFTRYDGNRPFIYYDKLDNELVIKALDYESANRYLKMILREVTTISEEGNTVGTEIFTE